MHRKWFYSFINLYLNFLVKSFHFKFSSNQPAPVNWKNQSIETKQRIKLLSKMQFNILKKFFIESNVHGIQLVFKSKHHLLERFSFFSLLAERSSFHFIIQVTLDISHCHIHLFRLKHLQQGMATIPEQFRRFVSRNELPKLGIYCTRCHNMHRLNRSQKSGWLHWEVCTTVFCLDVVADKHFIYFLLKILEYFTKWFKICRVQEVHWSCYSNDI